LVATADGAANSVSVFSVAPAPPPPPPIPDCVVPQLKRKTLATARRMIRAAHCTIGKAKIPKRPRHKPGKHKRWKLIVGKQSPRANTVEPNGTSVKLTLVYTPARR
jgi:hypothetical protein